MSSGNVWTVPATVVRVVDGDTIVLLLDLGWHITFEARCRLIGINAPEMNTDESKAARAWVVEQLAGLVTTMNQVLGKPVPVEQGALVTFMSHKLDKYGRPLGEVFVTTAQGARWSLNSALIEEGHAIPMAE